MSGGEMFMQMRAARTAGVYRGFNLEMDNIDKPSKAINSKYESNIPTQLIIASSKPIKPLKAV